MPVTEKPIQEMRKEEYQRYTENLKDCLETGEELLTRVLDVTTHVENPCYMLKTGPSAIFNIQWLNTLARIRSRFFRPAAQDTLGKKGNTLQGSERFPLSLHGK